MSKALLTYLGGLTVTQGEGEGQPFNVLPWQKRFCRGAFSTPGDVALAIARGAGKSTLVAGIAGAHLDLDGPLTPGRRADVIVVASSFAQGWIIFDHLLAFLRASGFNPDNRQVWRVQDTVNQASIERRETGVRVRCIGSDPRRAHGLAPSLVLADEPAQWSPTKADAMIAALRTSLGKVSGSRLIALGTRPDSSDHWFVKLIAGGASYRQLHAAGKDDPPFRARTWRKANPSLAYMPALAARYKLEAAEAKRDPSGLASFKALRLNLGVSDTVESTLLDADVWERIETDGEAEADGPYALGVDLGANASMSAAAGYWPASGALRSFGVFPELPDLRARGLRDGVGALYGELVRRGELVIAGRRVASVPALLREALRRWGHPAVIVTDRWREGNLRDALEQAGVPLTTLSFRGQGFKDGGEDVRTFRSACLADKVRPSRSLLLRSAMAEARVQSDPAANAKLRKMRGPRARDDAVAAAILAVAEGTRRATATRDTDRPAVRINVV